MSSSTSLTDAVKAAATQNASLTDAVKEAARSGKDCTVISFPRNALEARQDNAVPLVHAMSAYAGGPHMPASGSTDASPGPGIRHGHGLDDGRLQDELVDQGPVEQPPPAAPRRPRLRWRRPAARPPADRAAPRRLRLVRGAPPGGSALRNMASAVRLAAVRLAGVLVVAALSLVAVPSPVGSDRPLPVATQKRVALVVGNSAYRHARKLENPTNDAADIGAALKRLGFQVIEGFDLDRAALERKIREFKALLRGADVGVFFYAGHGLHVSGQNYLVPVDAQLAGALALELELVRLDLVHRTMEREAKTNILFFDACRDNPLSDNLARAMGTRSAEVGRGLAIVQGGAGTLISFSTQPGTLALDGKGRNSPYSAALIKQLATSPEDLSAMLIAIRNDVMKATDSKQVPWEHSALTGRFYFNPVADAAPQTPPAPSRAREAFEAWSAAKDTTSTAVLEAFIARYSDTFYAELARARLAELRRHGAGPKGVPPVADLAPIFE